MIKTLVTAAALTIALGGYAFAEDSTAPAAPAKTHHTVHHHVTHHHVHHHVHHTAPKPAEAPKS